MQAKRRAPKHVIIRTSERWSTKELRDIHHGRVYPTLIMLCLSMSRSSLMEEGPTRAQRESGYVDSVRENAPT